MIETGHVIQRDLELVDQFRGRNLPNLDGKITPRIEPQLEQGYQLARQVDIRAERVREIGLAVRTADLAQVAADRSDDHHLPPRQVSSHHERVKTVRFAQTLIRGGKRLDELLSR